MTMRILVAIGLLGWWAIQARAYVPVWRSNQTLMSHVVARAPVKPRALLNYGVVLAAGGRLADGEQFLLAALVAAQQPQVRGFDRALTARDVAVNRAAMAALRGHR